ncbi:hypothetical protein D3C74_477160 [compost metagenome]
MKITQVREALEAGHRKFKLHSGVVGEVLKFGSSWVRYRTPFMKTDFLSINMKMFATDVIEICTEKCPDSASGK